MTQRLPSAPNVWQSCFEDTVESVFDRDSEPRRFANPVFGPNPAKSRQQTGPVAVRYRGSGVSPWRAVGPCSSFEPRLCANAVTCRLAPDA